LKAHGQKYRQAGNFYGRMKNILGMNLISPFSQLFSWIFNLILLGFVIFMYYSFVVE